jgi:hypothetical protein
MYNRLIFKDFMARLEEPRRFIQVLSGPRQVGKTTLVQQALADSQLPHHYASADASAIKDTTWVAQQWEIARMQANKPAGALLVLDEIQKITAWSEVVKQLWDEDTRNKTPLKVVLLGSAPILIQTGLTESLAGRFELVRMTHWSYEEMSTAFGWTWEQYVYFGGYPGAAPLIADESRWRQYIQDSLIDTTINRDILMLTRVDKPVLLKKLFELGCLYSGQILSFQKILGQLHDAGNTTTLAHYLRLLTTSGLLTGLQKFTGSEVVTRSSSPKLQALNTALISAQQPMPFSDMKNNLDQWGRLVESAVAAHLVNGSVGTKTQVQYWRQGNDEVDFVLTNGTTVVAIEVKSGTKKGATLGMKKFTGRFNPDKLLLVGGDGMALPDFFKLSVTDILAG